MEYIKTINGKAVKDEEAREKIQRLADSIEVEQTSKSWQVTSTNVYGLANAISINGSTEEVSLFTAGTKIYNTSKNVVCELTKNSYYEMFDGFIVHLPSEFKESFSVGDLVSLLPPEVVAVGVARIKDAKAREHIETLEANAKLYKHRVCLGDEINQYNIDILLYDSTPLTLKEARNFINFGTRKQYGGYCEKRGDFAYGVYIQFASEYVTFRVTTVQINGVDTEVVQHVDIASVDSDQTASFILTETPITTFTDTVTELL
jgi:hypothetical protein